MSLLQKGRSLLRSLVLIFVAIMIIANTVRDLTFYLDKTVVPVNSIAEIDKLGDNTTTEVTLPLDLKRAYSVRYLSQREFYLIPFVGGDYRLMYAVEGPLSDSLVAKLHPPFKGRVVTKDFGDAWEVYGKRIKLQKIFAKDSIDIPSGAMLIYDAPKEFPSLWMLFICTLSIAYLVYKAYSLVRPTPVEKAPEPQPETVSQP